MRRRLAIVALAVTALVVVAFLAPLALLVRSQARDRALAGAQREAQAVATGLSVAASLSGGRVGADEIRLVLASSDAGANVTVFAPDGETFGAPADTPNLEAARAGAAFTTEIAGGSEVLVPVSAGEDVTVVRAFASTGEQRRGVAGAWAVLGGLGVLLVGVAVVIADRLGRSVVRPVSDLAAAAHAFGEGDRHARVVPAGPEEVVEVGLAFNRLADRLDALLAAERESVADLSHRLRTPLAAIRLQAEAVDDPAARTALQADVDRLAAAVDRLIADARRPAAPPAGASDLGDVVRRRVAFWQVLAEEQEREVGVDVPPTPVPVALGADEAGALLDTLLENVFAHTPPGTGFRVKVLADGPAVVVADDGPGLASRDSLRRGASGSGSTGLGLDIARRVAEGSGGALEMAESPAGGVAVTATFGRPGSVSAAAAGLSRPGRRPPGR